MAKASTQEKEQDRSETAAAGRTERGAEQGQARSQDYRAQGRGAEQESWRSRAQARGGQRMSIRQRVAGRIRQNREIEEAHQDAREAGEIFFLPFFAIQRQLNRVMEETWQSAMRFPNRMMSSSMPAAAVSNMPSFSSLANVKIMPKVHVEEDEDAFYLNTSVPGCDPEDIDISMHDNYMTITCDMQDVQPMEAAFGGGSSGFRASRQRTERTVMIPANGNANEAEANLEGDTLVIMVPKREEQSRDARHLRVGQR